MPYIGNQPGTGVRNRFIYTATASQTTFSGADDNSKTLKYADSNYIDVYLNGVCLEPGTDYTASTKTSVVLTQAASLNDTLKVIAYDVASMDDSISKADGGTFEANVTFADGADIITATAGTDNVRLGENAGDSITSGGNNNVTIGKDAGTAITTGDANVAVGFEALATEDANGQNVAVGYRALKTLNAGTEAQNTAVGYNAGTSITTGVENVLVGATAGDAITDADFNVGIGWGALGANVLGSKSVAVGTGVLDAQNPASATDMHNTAVGHGAGGAVTTGIKNTIVGSTAGDALTTGDSSVAIGFGALTSETAASNSIAIGQTALENQNIGSGDSHNIAIGRNAGGQITSGINNVLIGGYTGDATDDGEANTAVGYLALSANCGDGNSVLGSTAGMVITGENNTTLGVASGRGITSGSNNITIGSQAGRSGSPGGNITTGSNEIGLGDGNISSFSCQVSLTATSDERDKTDFQDLDLGLAFVKELKPVTYVWDKRINYGDVTADDFDLDSITSDGTHKDDDLQVGFKAQEVIALEDSAGYKLSDKTNLTATVTSDGKQYGLMYERFVPILTKAIQELSAKVDALETENTAIKARLDALEAG